MPVSTDTKAMNDLLRQMYCKAMVDAYTFQMGPPPPEPPDSGDLY